MINPFNSWGKVNTTCLHAGVPAFRHAGMIVSGRQELGGFKLNPLFFFEGATGRTMPIATTVVLPMLEAAGFLITPVAMHAAARSMTPVQFIEHSTAIRIE